MNEDRKKKINCHLKQYGKKPILLFCIMLILSLAIGGTVAYIAVQTSNVINQFEPARVTCRVNVNSDDTIDVTNTGNVDAYIRAAIVVNWMDVDGNVFGIAPTSSQYTLGINTTDWQKHTDGFYYYKFRVTPEPDNTEPDDDTTKDLVTSISTTGASPSMEYTLSVEVVAEAIQADGSKTEDGNVTKAYIDAWINSASAN